MVTLFHLSIQGFFLGIKRAEESHAIACLTVWVGGYVGELDARVDRAEALFLFLLDLSRLRYLDFIRTFIRIFYK